MRLFLVEFLVLKYAVCQTVNMSEVSYWMPVNRCLRK